MGETKEWAPYSLREAPFYHKSITPEEYESERMYYYENFETLVKEGKYKPLWKQKQENIA